MKIAYLTKDPHPNIPPRGKVILTFLFLCTTIVAQERGSSFFIGSQAHYGFIIAHTAKIEPISHTKPYGFELNFNWLHTSYDSWKVFHTYNISGLRLAYFNYQNPDIAGSSYLLTVYTEPIIRKGGRFMFSVKGGGGISWQTKIYNDEKNPLNRFFSTRISFPLNLAANLKYGISDNLFITLSANYNHISNGAMKLPNMGINYPTASAGIEIFPGSFPALNKNYVKEGNPQFRQSYIVAEAITGYKVVYGLPTWSWGVSSRFTRQLKTFYAINAGAELMLDNGIRKVIEIEERYVDYRRFALTAGQDFFLGRIIFSQHLGVYLYSPYKAKAPVYQKYALEYRIRPRLFAGVFLKAHTSDAELFGFSASYIIPLQKP